MVSVFITKLVQNGEGIVKAIPDFLKTTALFL
jgi:hypothetical protein